MLAVRAPNHLGDGIMAMPAIRALATLGPLTVHAPGWGGVLYRDIDARVVPRGPIHADTAVLLAPSLRAALEARRCRRRVGVAWDLRRWLLTDVVEEGTHQADTYARLAAAVGARVDGTPGWVRRPDDPLPDVPSGHIGLNPVSVGGGVREWRRWLALADRVAAPPDELPRPRLSRPLVFYGGPGEQARVAAVAGPHRREVGLSLPAFAGALTRCAVFVSNDSGAAHFARACGVPTVVIFGSTTAGRTGPAGARGVDGPALTCRPCYGRRCRVAPPDVAPPCLDIGVEAVLTEIRTVLERGDG